MRQMTEWNQTAPALVWPVMKERPKTEEGRPLEGLTQIGELLAGFMCGALLGALIGLGVGHYLRRRGLRWTWGLLLVPLAPAVGAAVILSPLSGWPAAAALGVAAGVPIGSIGWGIYRRLEDHRAGGDRDSAARERRALSDPLRQRVRERAAKMGPAIEQGIALGRTGRKEIAWIRRGTRESGSHVLIPGATGAGKTTSLSLLLVEYVARSGFGAVVMEAKIDERLRAAAEAAAAARGAEFRLISPEGPCGYNPLARGSVDERTERLMAVWRWGSDDADFYRQAAAPFLKLVVRTLDTMGVRTTLRTVAEHCDPELLVQVAGDELEDEECAEEIARHTAALGSDVRRAIGGLRARLFNLADSEFAREWLDPSAASGPVVDLGASVLGGEVVYFRLDTDRTETVGQAIAQMAMLDLGAVASSIMGRGVGTLVAIDEFGALESPGIDRLYTRGRSAGMSVVLGTQTVADLGEASPATRERVGATIESIVCHRLGNQGDAEWVSELIGTVATWHTTTRTDALGLSSEEGTRSRGHRFEVHPSELQRLKPGEAYVARLDLDDERRAHSVPVQPPWERLKTLQEPG